MRASLCERRRIVYENGTFSYENFKIDNTNLNLNVSLNSSFKFDTTGISQYRYTAIPRTPRISQYREHRNTAIPQYRYIIDMSMDWNYCYDTLENTVNCETFVIYMFELARFCRIRYRFKYLVWFCWIISTLYFEFDFTANSEKKSVNKIRQKHSLSRYGGIRHREYVLWSVK